MVLKSFALLLGCTVLCVYMCECVCNVNVYTIIIIIACVPWAPLPAKLAPKLHREVHVV